MKPRGAILESPSAHLLSLVRWLLLIACAGLGQIERASAQDVAFAVKIATNTVAVNSSVTYTMNVTNRTGLSILNVVVTNRFSGPAAFQITGASTTQGTIVTNSASIAFTLGQLLDGSVAVLTTTIKPTSSGSLTNAALLAIPNSTNTTTTNVVLEVLPPSTDLAAMFVAPATPVVVGDTTTYTIGATNLGTNSVANVNLQSTGFNAFALLSLSPTNQSYTLTNGTLTMNIGTLAARAGKTFTVSAKATNAGTFALSTAVTATNITESDPSNNVVSKTLT
ncbi:MAG: hypothetical protein RLY20_391, partial [Verrucomicrobiota bacterium]